MTKILKEKTHWLQNPNKNYLGHWDLPSGQDVVLTIKSAGWEEVKNPIINTKECKRVVRFVETDKWVKPFICNEVNAQTILKSTGEKYMEDCIGKKIKIGIGQVTVKKVEVDCLRVRSVNQKALDPNGISEDKVTKIQELLSKTDKTAKDIYIAYKVNSLKELNEASYNLVIKRLLKIINENN